MTAKDFAARYWRSLVGHDDRPPSPRHWQTHPLWRRYLASLLDTPLAARESSPLAPRVHVPEGTIGLVVAKVGAVRAPENVLARHLGTDAFRDGEWFRLAGGEQGQQLDLLRGGFHEIDAEAFEVITVETPETMWRAGLRFADLIEVLVPEGQTGVVVVRVGARPDQDDLSIGRQVDGHDFFQRPWEFLARGGRKGVQEETLRGGHRYAINPWFAQVVLVPARPLVVRWTEDEPSEGARNLTFGPIMFNVEGYTVQLDLVQTIRIPARTAPRLVHRYGAAEGEVVRRFVERQLGPPIQSFFADLAANYRVMDLITQHRKVRDQLATTVERALEPTGVVPLDTYVGEFQFEQPAVEELLKRFVRQQRRFESASADLDQPGDLGDDAVERLRGRAEEEKRRLETVEVHTRIGLLSLRQVGVERINAELTRMNVPQIIGEAGGDVADALLQAMPIEQARALLSTLARDPTGHTTTPDRPTGANRPPP